MEDVTNPFLPKLVLNCFFFFLLHSNRNQTETSIISFFSSLFLITSEADLSGGNGGDWRTGLLLTISCLLFVAKNV